MDSDSSPNFAAEMTSPVLLLTAFDDQGPLSGGHAEKPIWNHVDMRIERAFAFGGSVILSSGKNAFARSQGFTIVESIAMESLPKRFRLIFTPSAKSLSERADLHEWWEPGNAPFRGTVAFGDDAWDARTVCADVSVAKRIFKDFFDHGTLVETLGEMRSIWDPKESS